MHNIPLKPAQHLILLLLAEKPSYGVELLQRLDERSRGVIRLNAGSLYRLISQMVEAGLLASVAEEPGSGGVGAPRKIYGLTPEGREVLRADVRRRAEWVEMARSLDLLEEGR